MTAVLNIVLPILAIVCFIAAFIFLMRGLRARTRSMHQAYGVGQQESRHLMLVSFLRSFVALILALVFLGLFGLAPRQTAGTEPALPNAITPEIAPIESPTTTLILTATTTIALPTLEPSPTIPLPTATATLPLTATVAITGTVPLSPTTGLPTAVVSSGVGVYLRAEPSTTAEQLEYLVDGTAVTLLPGRQTAEDLEWAQVRTVEGLEGWVALDFLIQN